MKITCVRGLIPPTPKSLALQNLPLDVGVKRGGRDLISRGVILQRKGLWGYEI